MHECGCKTHWSDDLNHPLYDKVCTFHKHLVPNGWFSEAREPVKASA